MTGSPRLAPPKTADIFCKVIDNFGDAGVCWRLARQLADEHRLRVRLLIDRPEVLAEMLPALAVARARSQGTAATTGSGHLIEGVEILDWREETSAFPGPPADLVIAAFACDLPPQYRASMSGLSRFMSSGQAADQARATTSVAKGEALSAGPCSSWINLEYLSAEPWVEDTHALPSLKPDGLVEQFYFPGFNHKTGGLIREAGLLARRDAFLADEQARLSLSRELGISQIENPSLNDSLLIFVFCYRAAPLNALLRAAGLALDAAGTLNLSTALSTGLISPLSDGICRPLHHGLSTALPPQSAGLSPDLSPRPPALSTPEGHLSRHLPTACPQPGVAPATRSIRQIRFLLPQGMATENPPQNGLPAGVSVHRIPRLPQARFDEILWLCDANFVRGEDSFVRAIWAGKPMIWHIYPQRENAHGPKLEAFLAMRPESERALSMAWNGLRPESTLAAAFAQWLTGFGALQTASQACCAQLASQPDLASQLMHSLAVDCKN